MSENKNSKIDSIINTIELHYKDRDKQFETALNELARIICYSVVNKCINVLCGTSETDNELTFDDVVGSNKLKTMRLLKSQIKRDSHNLDLFAAITKNVKIETKFKKNGDSITTERYTTVSQFGYEIDDDANINDHLFDILNVGYGYDLIQTALCTILTELKEIEKRNGAVSVGTFTETYEKTKVNKSIRIQLDDNESYYKTYETSAIVECFKAVRRAIESNNQTSIHNTRYTYIEDLFTNSEGETVDDVLLRVSPKSVYNTATTTTDCTEVDTITGESIMDIDDVREQIFEYLTPREKLFFEYYLRGYGYKAIATYFKVSLSTVKEIMRRARKKIIYKCSIDTNFDVNFATTLQEKQIETEKKSEGVRRYKAICERAAKRKQRNGLKCYPLTATATTDDELKQQIRNELYHNCLNHFRPVKPPVQAVTDDELKQQIRFEIMDKFNFKIAR